MTKAIQSVDPAAGVETDPAIRKVVVTSSLPRSDFEAVLAEAGYPTDRAA